MDAIGEQQLGLYASLTSAIIANLINYSATAAGVPDRYTVPFIVAGIGNFLAIYFDIMIAKKTFGQNEVRIPHTALGKRHRWFVGNIFGLMGFKFIVVALADAVVALRVYRVLKGYFDARGWLLKYQTARDAGLAIVATTITFLLFGNFLRFRWAYESNPTAAAHAYAVFIATVAVALQVFA